MLVLYVVALGIGGTLVAASLLLGGHDVDHDMDAGVDSDFDAGADTDFDADADVDHDVDAHVDADHEGVGAVDAVMGWLPFMSVRFWIFFLAFFGLTGTALTLAEAIDSRSIIGVVSGVIGYLAGVGVVASIRRLRKTQVDSSLTVKDYVGATGIVMVRVGKESTGKVRLQLKGRSVELLARTEEEMVFEPKQVVMVYGVTDDGQVMVTKSEQLEA